MTAHQHKEAFCLMWYACKDCGHRERLWNSRDGVTPFGCSCPSCGRTMLHVEWQLDELAVDYRPHRGQGFWRDGTPDEAEAIIRRRIELFQKKYPISSTDEARLIQSSRDGTEGEFQKGWPMLERATR